MLYFTDWSVFFVLVLKGELNIDVEDKSFQQFPYVDVVECRLLKTKVRGGGTSTIIVLVMSCHVPTDLLACNTKLSNKF